MARYDVERRLMEPISAIAASLASGAAAVGSHVASELVMEAYGKLKERIRNNYPKVSVDLLEQAPQSSSRRAVIEEDLAASGAGDDPELLAAAQTLAELIQKQAPPEVPALSVNPESVTCGSCGATFHDNPDAGPEERKPCPVCGSRTRRFYAEARIAVSGMVAVSGNIIVGGTETGIKPAEPWPLPESVTR
jgi:rubrerythrin